MDLNFSHLPVYQTSYTEWPPASLASETVWRSPCGSPSPAPLCSHSTTPASLPGHTKNALNLRSAKMASIIATAVVLLGQSSGVYWKSGPVDDIAAAGSGEVRRLRIVDSESGDNHGKTNDGHDEFQQPKIGDEAKLKPSPPLILLPPAPCPPPRIGPNNVMLKIRPMSQPRACHSGGSSQFWRWVANIGENFSCPRDDIAVRRPKPHALVPRSVAPASNRRRFAVDNVERAPVQIAGVAGGLVADHVVHG